jgi:nucleoside-triphosphatase
MARHLFLTGEKGIGKSTLLKMIESRSDKKIGGFLTVKTDSVFEGKISIHILKAGEKDIPSKENVLFFPHSDIKDMTKNFDTLAYNTLKSNKDCQLLMMDELGPREEFALKFQQEVFELLDKETPIIGVIQMADSKFLEKVSNHPQVKVVEVTRENRDELANEFRKYIKNYSEIN